MKHLIKILICLFTIALLTGCYTSRTYDYPVKGKYVESENIQRNLVNERTQELADEI